MLSESVSTIGDTVPFHYMETNNEKIIRNQMPELEPGPSVFTTCVTLVKFPPLGS